jgi:hypothetical protein
LAWVKTCNATGLIHLVFVINSEALLAAVRQARSSLGRS